MNMGNDLRPVRPPQRDLIQRAFRAWHQRTAQEHESGLLFLTPTRPAPTWRDTLRGLLP